MPCSHAAAYFVCLATRNTARTATWISKARPVSVLVLVFAAVILGCQLRSVHDSTNLSRDIGLIGRILTVLFCESRFFFVLAGTPRPHAVPALLLPEQLPGAKYHPPAATICQGVELFTARTVQAGSMCVMVHVSCLVQVFMAGSRRWHSQ